jgi:hypothetical protein
MNGDTSALLSACDVGVRFGLSNVGNPHRERVPIWAENGTELGTARSAFVIGSAGVEFLDRDGRRVCATAWSNRGRPVPRVWSVADSEGNEVARVRRRLLGRKAFDVTSAGARLATLARPRPYQPSASHPVTDWRSRDPELQLRRRPDDNVWAETRFWREGGAGLRVLTVAPDAPWLARAIGLALLWILVEQHEPGMVDFLIDLVPE